MLTGILPPTRARQRQLPSGVTAIDGGHPLVEAGKASTAVFTGFLSQLAAASGKPHFLTG